MPAAVLRSRGRFSWLLPFHRCRRASSEQEYHVRFIGAGYLGEGVVLSIPGNRTLLERLALKGMWGSSRWKLPSSSVRICSGCSSSVVDHDHRPAGTYPVAACRIKVPNSLPCIGSNITPSWTLTIVSQTRLSPAHRTTDP